MSAPTVFVPEYWPVPFSFEALTIATTRSPNTRLNGSMVSELIWTKQFWFWTTVGLAPLHSDEAANSPFDFLISTW